MLAIVGTFKDFKSNVRKFKTLYESLAPVVTIQNIKNLEVTHIVWNSTPIGVTGFIYMGIV